MKNFTITEIESFTGIKAHTIRVWESRYNLFQPERNSGNTRFYMFGQLQVILNVALLSRFGMKVSQLATISAAEIEEIVRQLKTPEALESKMINRLIVCMFSTDIEEFEDILDSAVITWGIDVTIQKIIIPFLEKVQVLSYDDSSAEVHFIVTAVRKKLISGIEKSHPSSIKAKTALLFLPKNQHFDLLLLYLAYVIKKDGLRVLYLGTNISEEALQKVTKSKKPDCLFTYASNKQTFAVNDFSNYLDVHLPSSKLFVMGDGDNTDYTLPENVQYFNYREVASTLGICNDL